MYICNLCDKTFKYESYLKRHKNKKIKCNKPQLNYNCELCKINFKYQSKLLSHQKTKKHIIIVNGNNNNINSQINNSYNNIFNLTVNMNSFQNTDTSQLRKATIELAGLDYVDLMEKNYLSEVDKIKEMFSVVLNILEKLHFSLEFEENHNLKILIVFPYINKRVHEYLILDINSETKEVKWVSLEYKELMPKLLTHLYNLNNTIKNNNYDKLILTLEKHLLTNKEISKELKPYIKKKLEEIYINFNTKQKKEPRENKNSFQEKVEEYKIYRNEECKLNNGFLPKIVNSKILD